MKKLPIDLSYIKRCGYCNGENRYIMRAPNVNTGVTDDDANRMAIQHVGSTEGGFCESCKMITQMTVVAYDFGKRKGPSHAHITREWKQHGCALTFGNRQAMREHWKEYHATK